MNVIADQKNLAANNHNNTSKVVSELIGIVSNNPTLAIQINDALKGQKKASFWHGKATRDMYRFFNQWLVFNSTVDDPEKFIVEFDNFANSPTGKIVLENNVFQSWLTSFMEARGEYLNSKASAKHIKQWQSSPKINIKDYIIPKGGYKNFNDFFTRKLKPGARPISNPKNPSILVSPADCGMRLILNRATDYSKFKLKGDQLNIRQSLNNNAFAKYFIGGKVTSLPFMV